MLFATFLFSLSCTNQTQDENPEPESDTLCGKISFCTDTLIKDKQLICSDTIYECLNQVLDKLGGQCIISSKPVDWSKGFIEAIDTIESDSRLNFTFMGDIEQIVVTPMDYKSLLKQIDANKGKEFDLKKCKTLMFRPEMIDLMWEIANDEWENFRYIYDAGRIDISFPIFGDNYKKAFIIEIFTSGALMDRGNILVFEKNEANWEYFGTLNVWYN